MGLFKPRIDKQITDAITSRDRIASRLTEAGIGIADLKAEAERAALSGAADDVLDKVEGKMRALIDRSTTLQAALSASETLVADLTRQRDEAADRKEREEGAASLELMAREAVEAGATLAAAADRLQRIMTRAAPCGAMEANGFINFAAMAKVEIPAGSDLIAQLVRTYRQALLDGRVSSRLPVPPEAFVEFSGPGAAVDANGFHLARDEMARRRWKAAARPAVSGHRIAAAACGEGAQDRRVRPARRCAPPRIARHAIARCERRQGVRSRRRAGALGAAAWRIRRARRLRTSRPANCEVTNADPCRK